MADKEQHLLIRTGRTIEIFSIISMKMVDIQKSLVGGFPKIVAPGRKLLMQGFLMKVPRAGGGSGLPRYYSFECN